MRPQQARGERNGPWLATRNVEAKGFAQSRGQEISIRSKVMKLVVIGAGALRNIGAVCDYCKIGEEVRGSDLVLVDTDPERLEVACKVTRKMPEVIQSDVRVEATTSLDEALPGADFVYVTIRVGGVSGMIRDEEIGIKHGFHGHDDFGPSAAFIALRTIPVMLDIARKMEKHCPNAWMLNLTNPVAVLCEALAQRTRIKHVGLCDGPRNLRGDLAGIMGWKSSAGIECHAAGINHFGWGVDCWHKGQPLYPMLDKRLKETDYSNLPEYMQWMIELYRLYGNAIFATAHCFHWFYHDEKLEGRRNAYRDRPPRDDVQQQEFEQLKAVADQLSPSEFWNNEAVAKFKSHRQNLAISVVEGFLKQDGRLIELNVRNNGAITNLPEDALVEVSCRIAGDKVEPVQGLAIPEQVVPLTKSIIYHQKLLIRAAFEKKKKVLLQSLMADPIMMQSYHRVIAMLDELIEANKEYLQGWDMAT